MEKSRNYDIERLAGDGKLESLKKLLDSNFTQSEIDIALSNALAYSQIKTAKYLISLGANISREDFDGVYYAVHNDELKGLMYSISQGVDINVKNGMILNTSIITATNTKNIDMTKWILSNGGDINLLTKDSIDLVKRYGTDELKELIQNA
ncbi:hypothetical protein [Aquimarina algiphila]|uniref:hypothetical protein n=1 Tax=Aquimarina algiphila TaxID=2047982 RepID=UPI00232D5BCB|nr:hypothetical protein [Aquimarina algiphila]